MSPALDERRQRNREADWQLAMGRQAAQHVARLPFVRGVFLSGSLSKNVMTHRSDVDLFLVAAKGRVWCLYALLRVLRSVAPSFRELRICPNFLVDQDSLAVPDRNIFTATELMTLIPVCGPGEYGRLLQANAWARERLPHHPGGRQDLLLQPPSSRWVRFVEGLFRGRIGDRVDGTVMRFLYRRWPRQSGFQDLVARGAFRCAAGVVKLHGCDPGGGDWQSRLLGGLAARLPELEARAGVPVVRREAVPTP
jgi:hypothetical protein